MASNRIAYGVLFLGLVVFYIMLTDYLSWLVLVCFLFSPSISLVLTALFCSNGALDLKVTESVTFKGGDIHLSLDLRDPAALLPVRTLVELSVTNEFMQTEERETLILTAGNRNSRVDQILSSACCGLLCIRVEKTGVVDFLGLFRLSHNRDLRRSTLVLVMPDRFPLAAFNRETKGVRDAENDGLMQVVPGDDPSELYDLRDYQPGDRVTRIHWKLSDKFDRLMVKDFGRVVSNDMLILVDFNGDREEQGGVMDAFYSMSAFLIEAGITHDVEWYCGQRGYGIADKIGSVEDLNRVLFHMLSEGRPQESPLAMQIRNHAGRRTWYTRIACLCGRQGLTEEDLALLDEKSGDSRLLVLCCGNVQDGEAEDLDPKTSWERFRGEHPNIELVFFDPTETALALEALVV